MYWCLFAALAFISGCAVAVPIADFYPYGKGLDKELEIGDDIATTRIDLAVPVVYFGERKYHIYVSTNGLVSFDQPIPKYTGALFPLGAEVIAPFYADVDVRSAGDVFYRETKDAKELEQAGLDINRAFRLSDRFTPTSLFVVSWVMVGSYSQRFEKLNAFQLVIANNGYDSFAMFLYLDEMIQWVQAELKDNIPEVAAQAGFDAGSRNFLPYTLPDSGFIESANWDRESNAARPGLWFFRIGNVRNIETPANRPTVTAPIGVTNSSGESGNTCPKCHKYAQCIGKCCKCSTGYYGNGIYCLKTGGRVRLNGIINGKVNGINISGVDMHVYVEARTYTGLSRLPPLIGYPIQLVVPIGELMGWLFALGDDVSQNGFGITGGKLNYTAELAFGSSRLSLRMELDGLNTQDEPKVMAISMNGNLPTNVHGGLPTFKEHTVDYSKIRPGVYRAQSTRSYTVDGVLYQYDLAETIEFYECQPTVALYRIRHAEYYVRYNENELATRFAIITDREDTAAPKGIACANHDCHINADCIPRNSSYVCSCKQGYAGNGKTCTDINECSSGATTCSQFADCTNTDGGYTCRCQFGYSGDGYYCAQEEERSSCRDLVCSEHAICDYLGEEPFCSCKPGFRGNGFQCFPIAFTCDERDICHSNAQCVFNEVSQTFECQCLQGFSGDGDNCTTPIDASCAYCSFNAQCSLSVDKLVYQCVCLPGYTGDGKTCQLLESTDGTSPLATVQTAPTATPTATPDLSPSFKDSCLHKPSLCDPNASCLLRGELYVCVCNEKYLGTGQRCVPAECSRHSDCSQHARCMYSKDANRYRCVCNDGYDGDGKICTSVADTTCNELNNCHADADCISSVDGYQCVCRQGFIGDGIFCAAVHDNCMSRPTLCDRNAVCSRTSDGDFVCICNPGYRGDGTTCIALNERGNYLIFTQGMSVMRVPFYQAGSETGRRILYKKGEKLVGLAADCQDRKFYFSDVYSGTIGRATLSNASDAEIIIKGLSSPEGLAVDWISRTLFWTDSGNDRIEVSRLDGTNRKVIVDKDLANPRSIVLDPSKGKMYWADWDRARPKIEVANMDGSGRRVLVDTDLSLPNGLAFDQFRQELCWADAGTRKIECVKSDGSGRTVMYNFAIYPFAITTFRDNFYWTDWDIKSIQTMPRGGAVLGSGIAYPPGGNGKAYSIESVPGQCTPGTNRCSYNNGDCRFLCLPVSHNKAVCACPDDVPQDQCNQLRL